MALRRAAESGSAERVKELLGRKADVHERERYGGYTALHYASTPAVARLLLEAHADAEEKSYAGTTPLQLAQRRGCWELARLLESAQVEEGVRRARLEVKRQAAGSELASALISRGVPDLATLETMPAEVSAELRQDGRLRHLLVHASAIQEAEVLLAVKAAAAVAPHAALVRAVDGDDYEEVQRLVSKGAADLMQRDPHGSLPVHHCRSVNVYRLLVASEPRSADVRNKLGRTPLECLWEHCAGLPLLQEFWCGGPPAVADERAPVGPDAPRLLRPDPAGVSPCMRAEGKAREWLLEQLSPWDDFQRQFKLLESLPDGLNKLAPDGHWREVLAFHLFGEPDVWKDGKLTALCSARLEELGGCLRQLCQRVLRRTPEAEARQAMEALEALLEATRGPAKLADARAPYRAELGLEMLHLARQSEAIHEILYAMMSGQAASALKAFVDERSGERLDPFGVLKSDPLQQWRDRPQLRMDCEFAQGGKHLAAPGWAHADIEFDLAQVLRDLRHVGGAALDQCLGQETCGPSDAVYRMLEGQHGFGPDAFPADVAGLCEPVVAFWYALWLRGLCQGRHQTVMQGLAAKLRALDTKLVPAAHPWDRQANFFPALEAASLDEICTRVLEELRRAFGECQERLLGDDAPGPEAEALARQLLSIAPRFVVGLNRATVIFEEPEGIRDAVEVLKAAPGGVLQVQNTFHKKAAGGPECRSLKVWVPVKSDRYGPLVTEVTLMLADDYWENSWHRLPLQYFRGGFDRRAVPERPSADALERHIKGKFQLNPALIPESRSKAGDGDVDEDTQRKMRELQERKAREAERLAQEEARCRREELERKLKEASADFDPDQCEVIGNMTIRPPVEVLPKTKRGEAREMRKLEQWNKKKASESQAAEPAS